MRLILLDYFTLWLATSTNNCLRTPICLKSQSIIMRNDPCNPPTPHPSKVYVSCSIVSYKKKRLSVSFRPLCLFSQLFVVVFLIKKHVNVSFRPLGTIVHTVM